MFLGMTSKGSALTRKARKALAGKVESVKVQSFNSMGGGGEVSGQEIEPLMSARQFLIEAGIECSAIQTQYKAIGPRFYIGQGASA